ncbi:TPA: 50S ribosomal protein L2 [Candidatus Woesearchaeota archaeon]|nr:50S ribosomal protein L2 [Candidatus Woesearchaeota archaeon]
MGKNIITQARGKGGPTYRAPSFRYKGAAKHSRLSPDQLEGTVIDILHCQGHSAPLAQVKYSNGEVVLLIAPEGIRVGQKIFSGTESPIEDGNTLPLNLIPEGAMVYNIESKPGDGGKFVRSSGVFAKVVSKLRDSVVIQLPSKKKKEFHPMCRASIGVVAGGGRVDKPFLNAGRKYFKMKAKNKLWPKISGSAQNAVDHPFGCKRSSRKSKARPIPRNAPPGRKVGMVAARRTGRKK